jgi:hypothetical protein
MTEITRTPSGPTGEDVAWVVSTGPDPWSKEAEAEGAYATVVQVPPQPAWEAGE